MAWTDQLFSRYGVHEFQQAAVEVGITFFPRRVGWQGIARQLSSQHIQRRDVLLNRWQRTEQLQPGFVALQGSAIALDEPWAEPRCWPLMFRNTNESRREKSSCSIKEQMEPGFPLVQGPDF